MSTHVMQSNRVNVSYSRSRLELLALRLQRRPAGQLLRLVFLAEFKALDAESRWQQFPQRLAVQLLALPLLLPLKDSKF